MNLTTHPVLHYALEFICFNLGLIANVLTAAHLSNSSKNNGVSTIKGYLAARWIPVGVRWLACVFFFLMVWENASIPFNAPLEKIMNGYLSAHLGASGFVGFGVDEFVAKITALLGIQRELPPVPQAEQP